MIDLISVSDEKGNNHLINSLNSLFHHDESVDTDRLHDFVTYKTLALLDKHTQGLIYDIHQTIKKTLQSCLRNH